MQEKKFVNGGNRDDLGHSGTFIFIEIEYIVDGL